MWQQEPGDSWGNGASCSDPDSYCLLCTSVCVWIRVCVCEREKEREEKVSVWFYRAASYLSFICLISKPDQAIFQQHFIMFTRFLPEKKKANGVTKIKSNLGNLLIFCCDDKQKKKTLWNVRVFFNKLEIFFPNILLFYQHFTWMHKKKTKVNPNPK